MKMMKEQKILQDNEKEGKTEILLSLRKNTGYRDGEYELPGGHVEEGETEEETALREVFEETNIKIELIDGFKKTDEYLTPRKDSTLKRVVYFLGKFQNQNVKEK